MSAEEMVYRNTLTFCGKILCMRDRERLERCIYLEVNYISYINVMMMMMLHIWV